MEHFKEYLTYLPFMVWTDNNPLTYVLTMPNLDATGHRWVGALALFQFEYQKGANNGATDGATELGSHQPQPGDHPISPRSQ